MNVRVKIRHPDPPIPRSRPLAIIAAIVAIALIGRLDLATSFDTSVAILYLLPVGFLAWILGRSWGLAAAFGSASIGLLSDIVVSRSFSSPVVPIWNAGVQLMVFAVVAVTLSALRSSLSREQTASRMDFVTGVANWRAFAEAGETELARMRRFGRPLTVVYMDCDDFKRVNDTQGHTSGDKLLRAIAEALLQTTREVDTVSRLGGDEFVVLLPETDPEAAETAVDRMRGSLRRAMAAGGWTETISFGAATFLKAPASLDELVSAADRLLYQAKNAGRDRVVAATYGEETRPEPPADVVTL